MNNNSTESIIDTEDDLFRFETEHLAVKGNEDYSEVLKTLVILSAQRQKAQEDFKSIAELRLKALDNPFEALEQLRNGTFTKIPPLMELPKLPQIDFQKYKVTVLQNDLEEIYSDETVQPNNNRNSENVKEIKKPSIPSSNKSSWTPEEQKRLEQLLQIYPPEPIEMRRFQKIANALGNRTTHQVASRLQKYFLKLYRAGLPIPGRIPKSAEKHKKSFLHKHQRHNHYLWKPTTFFPDLNVPVQMEDSDNIPGPSSEAMNSPSTSQNDNNYLVNNVEYHQDEEKSSESDFNNDPETQLNLLKRVRQIKELEETDKDFIPYVHVGFKCDYCEETPINGARWHCTICPSSVDFCTDCVVSQIYTESPHPQNHWLEIILNEQSSSLSSNNNKNVKSEFFQIDSVNEDDDSSSSSSSSSSSE